MRRKKVLPLLIIALVIILLGGAGCFPSREPAFREEGGYRFVYENEEKAWWFNMDSVALSQESEEEFIQAWVRIDFKGNKMTETIVWNFRLDSAEYKTTNTFTYDSDGGLAEA